MKPTRLARYASISLLTLGLGMALPAAAGERTPGEYVDDKVVSAKVKTALLQDGQVSGLAVNVETYQGTVQLSGFANTDDERARAEEVAKGVEGVMAVINDVLLKDEVATRESSDAGAAASTGEPSEPEPVETSPAQPAP